MANPVALVLALHLLGCTPPASPPLALSTSGSALPALAVGASGSSPNGRLTPDPGAAMDVLGLCEASGAVWVSDDKGGHLVVADDDQDRVLLEVWPGEAKGGAVQAHASEFGWEMKDLEGLALDAAGDLWMASSGSRKNSGAYDDERQRVARWRPGLGGGPMALLRAGEGTGGEAIAGALQDPRCPGCALPEGYEGRSPDDGGFNVEGLAAREGRLLFGLRSPQTTSGAAILLEAPAPERSGGLVAWSGAVSLDLGGRGVRDLLTVPGGPLLVLAGPGARPVSGPQSVIYAWRDGAAPVLLGELPTASGVTPEALAMDGAGALWVLYDAGDAIADRSGGKFDCARLALQRADLARTPARRFTVDLTGV